MGEKVDQIMNEGEHYYDPEEEEEDDDDEEHFVEKDFNFVSEVSGLADYDIVTKYCALLEYKDFVKN